MDRSASRGPLVFVPAVQCHSRPARGIGEIPQTLRPCRRSVKPQLVRHPSAMDDAVGRCWPSCARPARKTTRWSFSSATTCAGPYGHWRQRCPARQQIYVLGGRHSPALHRAMERALPAGKLYEQPAMQLDVMPTCLLAAGGTIDPAWKLDGVDLLPVPEGRKPAARTRRCTGGSTAAGPSATEIGSWFSASLGGDASPELFDLAADVGEQTDLSARHPEKVSELKALWDAWNAEQAPPTTAKEKAKKKAKKQAKRENSRQRQLRRECGRSAGNRRLPLLKCRIGIRQRAGVAAGGRGPACTSGPSDAA